MQHEREAEKTAGSLHDAIESARTKIPKEYFQNLVESMPCQIQAVLEAKGSFLLSTIKVLLTKWALSLYIDRGREGERKVVLIGCISSIMIPIDFSKHEWGPEQLQNTHVNDTGEPGAWTETLQFNVTS